MRYLDSFFNIYDIYFHISLKFRVSNNYPCCPELPHLNYFLKLIKKGFFFQKFPLENNVLMYNFFSRASSMHLVM